MKEKKRGFWGLFFKKEEVKEPEQQQSPTLSNPQRETSYAGEYNTDILCPASFKDIEDIIEKMKIADRPYLIDVAKAGGPGQRFLDVLSGAAQALDGRFTEINKSGLFFFNPKNKY